jgi:hypothetical protein
MYIILYQLNSGFILSLFDQHAKNKHADYVFFSLLYFCFY